MRSFLRTTIVVFILCYHSIAFSSGGYDNGTPAGKRHLNLDFTINPLNYFKYGQSYVVWGYGLTNKLDFHGYAARPASGINQIYGGLMYNFISNKYLDLSTAIGLRFRKGAVDPFFPQLLYTIKLPKGFDIIGSVVLVYYTDQKFKNITSYDVVRDNYKPGVTFDIALRLPLPVKKLPAFIEDAKFTIGAFRGVSYKWYPTYSVDIRFNLSNIKKKNA